MEALLEVRAVSAGYGSVPVIHDVNMHVSPGEVVALVGPNGVGKTTTLKAIGGYLETLGGDLRFGGAALSGAPHRRAQRGIAFVNESRSVLRTLSTRENLKLARVGPHRCLELFPELGARLDLKAGDLSGGEQQMLAVGRALGRKPRLLMADELSLGLAPLATERLLRAIQAAALEDDVAILLVEQHLNNVVRFADRAYLMVSGRIAFDGTAKELISSRSSVVQSYFGRAPERHGGTEQQPH
jgi:ABC-type branched-subunit amino acid transport system ATPase component